MFTKEAKQYGNKKNKTTDRHHGKILDSSEKKTTIQFNNDKEQRLVGLESG
jgi:hypothetical protein